MATPSVNLKTVVEADTSQFSASMKQVKSDMKDLGTVSSRALDSLGGAIGVDVGKLKLMSGALSGLAREFTQMGDEGSKAMGSILQSIVPVAGAIAGLGLAGAALAFKALTSEAEAFKRTVEGANMEMAAAAYIETYRQAFHDMNTDTGRAVAQAESSWKKFWGTLGTNIRLAFKPGTLGLSVDPDLGDINGENFEQMGSAMADFNAKGERAAEISNELYQLQRQINQKLADNARLDAEIAQLRADAIDPGKTAAQHAEALAQAQEKVRQKYDGPEGLIALQKKVAALVKENEDLVGDDAAAQEKINAELNKAEGYVQAKNSELKAITKNQNTVNNELKKEVELRRQAAELAKTAAAAKASMSEWYANGSNVAPTAAKVMAQTLQGNAVQQSQPTLAPIQLQVSNWAGFFKDVDGGILREWPNGVQVGVKFKYEEGLMDMTREVNAAMQSLAETTGSVIGQLVGDLTTGGNAWANFGDAAMSALGDMAISIGKIAIQAGIASLGIEAAITALGGPGAAMAIGAGVALVALGTAVKTGLSNVASGSYSAGASIASSGYSTSSGGDYETREINVKVTGTLTGEGSTLLGVINSTENKNYHTT